MPCLSVSVPALSHPVRVTLSVSLSRLRAHAALSFSCTCFLLPSQTPTTGRSGKNFRATGDTHMYWHRAVCRAPGAALHYRRVRARARTQKHTLHTPARAHTHTHAPARACMHAQACTDTHSLSPPRSHTYSYSVTCPYTPHTHLLTHSYTPTHAFLTPSAESCCKRDPVRSE